MRLITISDAATTHLTQWLTETVAGELQLWQLPPALRAWYTTGFWEGHNTRADAARIERLEHENERLWVLAHNKHAEHREAILRRLDDQARFDWAPVEARLLEIIATQSFEDATGVAGGKQYDDRTQGSLAHAS